MTIASLKDVGKRFFNGIEALAGFNINLAAGEKVSLLGPSGCGKSTALRILSGLETATTGIVTNDLPTQGALAFVFQDPTLLPWATVAKNIAMPLGLADVAQGEIEPRVAEMLTRVALSEFADSYPHELSGGMKMRVSIARALITRPSLLLMDEPFAALDEITRFRLNDMLLEQQAQEGFALLFVTHSVFESVYLSDRVAVMSPRPGKIVAEIKTAPKTKRNSDFRLSTKYIELCRKVSGALVLES